jgi:hypothetical protein
MLEFERKTCAVPDGKSIIKDIGNEQLFRDE